MSGLGRRSGSGASGMAAKANTGVLGRRAIVTMAWTLTWSEPAASSSTSHTPRAALAQAAGADIEVAGGQAGGIGQGQRQRLAGRLGLGLQDADREPDG